MLSSNDPDKPTTTTKMTAEAPKGSETSGTKYLSEPQEQRWGK